MPLFLNYVPKLGTYLILSSVLVPDFSYLCTDQLYDEMFCFDLREMHLCS